jgi:hypothetical protein
LEEIRANEEKLGNPIKIKIKLSNTLITMREK